ncbi:uncharacterized protein B0H18DRAFT_1007236 [Fomitopsis serialis]|uniref:uncharacterized protein n=1 Tax=Fomitopsis serialis TaxID=139415 RepID=UPI002007A5A2|nr:uncharacterized protein B0H18DRAFT_1007236 [Neoantrodia serialis]KAH9925979.1 hypothetical protein B0H18DRAFT_1007236 [Neoantrodia serialis]
MGEVLNVVVAVAVIVFIVRWATSGKDTSSGPSPSTVLGFRPKNVTVDMVDTVHTMFPDIPSDNIRYDLLRTGSVQTTTNTILERGFLPAPPPAYYTLYPRALNSTDTAPARRGPTPAAASSSSSKSKSSSLIERYNLEDRVALSSGVEARTPEEAAGRAVWEENAEKREASLRERKAQMILAARQRLLAQQAKEASSS